MEPEKKNPLETRNRIVAILRFKGPSLPIQIARETQINSLFAGAYLSELASEKTIRISDMKVGGSPLYFIPGQEPQLEKFYTYLPGKERDAFLLLQKNRILKDVEQEPAIRVALRQIKDFAVPFNFDNFIFWKFHTVTDEEIRNLVKSPEPKPIQHVQQPKPAQQTRIIKEKPKIQERLVVKRRETEKPLLEIKPVEKQEKKVKEKSGFVKNILSFLESEDIELIEEKETKKKEYSAIIRVDTKLGKIRFLLISKDKKRITDNDLALSVQKSQTLNLPALFLSPGELNKKAKSYLESSSLVIFRQLSKNP